jgi:hypothetical protein
LPFDLAGLLPIGWESMSVTPALGLVDGICHLLRNQLRIMHFRSIEALARYVFTALFGVALTLPAQGQRVKAGPDPYTKNDPRLLAKAGYDNLGPFAFGTGQTTGGIENLLGTEPLMWVETEHFRLGCALPPVVMKGREQWRLDWQKQIAVELKELRTVLPGIKKKPKQLDPWLRTHLYAQRLEKIYREVSDVLGVDDTFFPTRPGEATVPKEFRGNGPFFGMTEKFTVLIVRTGASHARYTRAYHGFELAEPIRIHDVKHGCMYWGCSAETANGLFRIDHALHANLAFNISHNLYTSFRGFSHDLPAWVVTGLGHWHARNVTPRFPTYDRLDDKDQDPRSVFWQWDVRVHGLAKNNVFEAVAPFIDRLDAGKYRVEQHMQSWSLVDFLLKNKKQQMSTFLHHMKDPFHARRRLPTAQELLVRQREALIKAFDCDVDDLEVSWRSAVLATKSKKRRRRG